MARSIDHKMRDELHAQILCTWIVHNCASCVRSLSLFVPQHTNRQPRHLGGCWPSANSLNPRHQSPPGALVALTSSRIICVISESLAFIIRVKGKYLQIKGELYRLKRQFYKHIHGIYLLFDDTFRWLGWWKLKIRLYFKAMTFGVQSPTLKKRTSHGHHH